MKKPDAISKNANYTAVNIGSLDNLADYSLIHPKLNYTIEGKVFLKESTDATGTEISFQVLQPKEELSYFHTHVQNEETYIILKGEGFFEVDDDCFPIKEGSVIRIAPDGVRGMCNSSDTVMVYMVVQSRANALEQWSGNDGKRVDHRAKWKK